MELSMAQFLRVTFPARADSSTRQRAASTLIRGACQLQSCGRRCPMSFAAQALCRTRCNGVAHVPTMRVRSVAARHVSELLVELIGGPPLGRALDLGRPEGADLVALARRFVERYDMHRTVVAATANPAVPHGATLPGAGVRLEGPRFGGWLEPEDAARLAI
jgi:hypothetical protein